MWYNIRYKDKFGGTAMTTNIYDTANQLERELRQSDEYLALKKAYATIQESTESQELFEQFRELTFKFQEMQMTGQQPTEEDIKHAEEVSKRAQENADITALMQAEQAVSRLMEDLNKIITQPLAEIYRP